LVQVIAPLEVQVVRGEVLGGTPNSRSVPLVDELRLELFEDRRRHAFLRRKYIVDRRIDRLGPQIATARTIDELRRQTDSIARATHAAADDQRGLGLFNGRSWFVRREQAQR